MDPRLLDILACPLCKGPLVHHREQQVLVCRADRLAFPIKDGIPLMLEEEAKVLAGDDPLLAHLELAYACTVSSYPLVMPRPGCRVNR